MQPPAAQALEGDRAGKGESRYNLATTTTTHVAASGWPTDVNK